MLKRETIAELRQRSVLFFYVFYPLSRQALAAPSWRATWYGVTDGTLDTSKL